MKESNLHRLIMRELSREDTRLFRNHVGHALMIRHANPGMRSQIIAACIALAERMGGSAARTSFGLCEDSADLIGWDSRVITPQMVGERVAIFTSIEVKTDRGRATDGQNQWDNVVRLFGGVSGIARSVDEAREIIAGKK